MTVFILKEKNIDNCVYLTVKLTDGAVELKKEYGTRLLS